MSESKPLIDRLEYVAEGLRDRGLYQHAAACIEAASLLSDLSTLRARVAEKDALLREAARVIGPDWMRKMETYLAIYSGDKELRRMIGDAVAILTRIEGERHE